MAFKERIQVLTTAEQTDFYAPPKLSLNDQRFLFELNDIELLSAKRIRGRKQRCMFVVLLGYFKAKPIVLSPRFFQVKNDLSFVSEHIFPGAGFRPFNLTQKETERIYQRIFTLCGVQRWREKTHGPALIVHLEAQAKAWSSPRHLFDAATNYFSVNAIAIPGYSTIQKMIGQVITQVHQQWDDQVSNVVNEETKNALLAIANSNSDAPLSLSTLRQSARNFTATELEKELTIQQALKPIKCEIKAAINALSLSPKNQQHFAERFDYYGAKLKQLTRTKQILYLLCYVQWRYQIAL